MDQKSSPRRLLNRSEVFELYGIPKRFLESHPAEVDGPQKITIGRLVFYHPDDVEKWLSEKRSAALGSPK